MRRPRSNTMTAAIAAMLATTLAPVLASADPHHILVLRAEGTADQAARQKVDVQILKLAKSVPGNIEAGDISLADASAAVGCNPDEQACKDEVLTTMGVDEIVMTTVNAAPGAELRVSVKRIAKGNAREATSAIPAGQAPDARLNADIGPLFGLVVATPPADKPKPPPTGTTGTTGTTGSTGMTGTTGATPVGVPPVGTATDHGDGSVQTAQAGTEPTVTGAPNNQVPPTTPEGAHDNSKLEIAGMAAGGGLLLISFIMWAEAASTQNDINNAPTNSKNDLINLANLQS
jgi:hypothetical protein